MKVFNTREAREHLRELLDAVEQGEVIGIKRHGHLIARLIPADDKRPRFPDRSAFRASISSTGGPASETVRQLRDEERY